MAFSRFLIVGSTLYRIGIRFARIRVAASDRRRRRGPRSLRLTLRGGVGHVTRMSKPASRPDPMSLALAEAEAAARRGEVPVGAVLVDGTTGSVLAKAGNRVEELKDPTAHAEMLAIRAAAARAGAKRLAGADLYVTLEPCPMCAQAISFARIRRLYFGAYDPKGGGVDHGARIFDQPTCHHRPEVYGGIQETRAGDLLRAFFRNRR
jgi:tRNA(Arg) A34 adenosine deaminase TadA